MKIIILLRYPLIERSPWKKKLIDRLISEKNDVTLIFGAKSVITQVKAILKEYGYGIPQKIGNKNSKGKAVNISKNYKNKIPVYKLSYLNGYVVERLIRKLNADIVLLLGSGIIRNNILKIPGPKFIHCHHGYLPFFRGVNTAEWNILFKGEVFLTTHFVDAGIDTGKIISRYKVDLSGVRTVEELRSKCREESVHAILQTIEKIKSGSDSFIEQKPEEGDQYFVMHPFFKKIVESRLQENVI